ncbi:hypothetical protein BpHYR1_003108, partial [Brachionus plicatilis]
MHFVPRSTSWYRNRGNPHQVRLKNSVKASDCKAGCFPNILTICFSSSNISSKQKVSERIGSLTKKDWNTTTDRSDSGDLVTYANYANFVESLERGQIDGN